MNKVCNLCGRNLSDNDTFFSHKTEDEKEYYLCQNCEENGVEILDKKKFYICGTCGFPHSEEQYSGVCEFCENKLDFKELYLTSVEEELLDKNPNKLYEQKLGKEKAKQIADWIESPKRKETGVRHKRDRQIDTVFFVGIVISYILLELNIRSFVTDWVKFSILLIPIILILISAPVFKFLDRKKNNKRISIWTLPIIIAILVDIYVILSQI